MNTVNRTKTKTIPFPEPAFLLDSNKNAEVGTLSRVIKVYHNYNKIVKCIIIVN